jgi:hypothetical protein
LISDLHLHLIVHRGRQLASDLSCGNIFAVSRRSDGIPAVLMAAS